MPDGAPQPLALATCLPCRRQAQQTQSRKPLLLRPDTRKRRESENELLNTSSALRWCWFRHLLRDQSAERSQVATTGAQQNAVEWQTRNRGKHLVLRTKPCARLGRRALEMIFGLLCDMPGTSRPTCYTALTRQQTSQNQTFCRLHRVGNEPKSASWSTGRTKSTASLVCPHMHSQANRGSSPH
jgi:hypothetical protein